MQRLCVYVIFFFVFYREAAGVYSLHFHRQHADDEEREAECPCQHARSVQAATTDERDEGGDGKTGEFASKTESEAVGTLTNVHSNCLSSLPLLFSSPHLSQRKVGPDGFPIFNLFVRTNQGAKIWYPCGSFKGDEVSNRCSPLKAFRPLSLLTTTAFLNFNF